MKKWTILLCIVCILALTGCEKKQTSQVTQKAKQVQTNQEKEITKESSNSKTQMEEVLTEKVIQETTMIKENVSLQNEEEVISYFRSAEQKVDEELQQSKTKKLSQKIKSTFITTVDFLFYGGTIGGVTFDSLSESAKLEILKITNAIDTKIEAHFPGYKESIKTTTGKIYDNASSKMKEKMQELDAYFHQKVGDDTYNQAKEDANNLKENFQNGFEKTGEVISEIGKNVKEKSKEWYENFKNKE